MLSYIRNSLFIRSFWGLIGLYLLNISVDTADRNPQHIAENLSINDQESIIEIVVEKILSYENAIKEYDDHDTEQHNKKANIKIDLTTHSIVDSSINQFIIKTTRNKFTDYKTFLISGFQNLDIPPPKI
jgi:hypothetical protein